MTWPPDPSAGLAESVIDAPVIGGVDNAVLFVGPTGRLAQDPGFFDYDKTTHVLTRHAIGAVGAEVVYDRVRVAGDHPEFTRHAVLIADGDAIYREGTNNAGDPRWGGISTSFASAAVRGGELLTEWYISVNSRDGATAKRPLTAFGVTTGAADLSAQLGIGADLVFVTAPDGVTPWGAWNGPFLLWEQGFRVNTYAAPALAAQPFEDDNVMQSLAELADGVFGDHNRLILAHGARVTGVECFRPLVLGNFTGPAVPFAQLSMSVGLVDIMGDTVDPNGVYTARAGSLYVRSNGATSNLYVNTSVGVGSTWTAVM